MRIVLQFAAVVAIGLATGPASAQQRPGGFAFTPFTQPTPPPFTAEQVERGRKLYAANCESCHGAGLGGGPVGRPLKGNAFKWGEGHTFGDVFNYMRTKMPPGRAGELSADDYAALLAMLLSEGGVKPGEAPLPPKAESLAAFKVVMPPHRGEGGLARKFELPSWPETPNPAVKLSDVTDEMLRDPPAGDWLLWRRTLDGLGFSPLKEITKTNVRDLRLVWSYALPPGPNVGTPLVHDGVIFVHGSGDTVSAFNAETGDVLWTWRHEAQPGLGGGVKRNMALYGDKLYLATGNATEGALEAKTGKLVWESPTGTMVSGGPLVVNGKVIQGVGRGQGLGEMPKPGAGPCTSCSGAGHVLGFDAATGKPLWTFNVIPEPGELGYDSWNDLPPGKRNGGAVWTTSYYDPQLNLVFTGTANTYDTAPLQKRSAKPGITNDALFTDSTLALNPDTGKLVWYFQHMANDQWDHDWVFEQQIIPLTIDGKLTKTVVTMGKIAILDAVEAATGRYLFSIDAGLQNTVLRIDPKTGAKITDPKLVPGGTTKFVCPQAIGAKNWTPSAYNPETGMLYASLSENCMTMEPIDPGDVSPFSSGIHYNTAPRPNSDGKYGRVQAFDLKQRKLGWAARQRAPMETGILATAGGLVFAGALDRGFAAYDDVTGEVLWRTRLANIPSGAPITFSVNGKQYLAVITGTGSALASGLRSLVPEIQTPATPSSSIYVFALP